MHSEPRVIPPSVPRQTLWINRPLGKSPGFNKAVHFSDNTVNAIADLLNGAAEANMPPVSITFKQAEKVKGKEVQQSKRDCSKGHHAHTRT